MIKQLVGLVFTTILAGVSVSIVAAKFDPFAVDEGIRLLFFASLFAFLWGLGTMAFFVINLGTRDRWVDSFRRGLFLYLVFLLLVFFKRHDILAWYMGAISGGVFIFLEVWIYKKFKKFNANVQSEDNNY